MRILNIGTGTQIFQPGCEDRARMVEYGKMVDRVDILISCCGNFDEQKLSDNVTIYATNSRYKWLRPIDTFIQGNGLIKRDGIDVVFCQDPLINGLTGWLLAKKHKVKLFISVFGTSVFDRYWQKEHWYNHILRFVGKMVMNDADALQTDSFGNFETLKKVYSDKTFWKPIVPSDLKNKIAEKKEFVDEEVRILFVGRMAKQKNIGMLAEIIDRICKKQHQRKVSFTIIGEGGERYRLEKFRNRDDVKLIDRSNRDEIYEIFNKSDILIMTSFYEGTPRVFLEAAANGLAFVVTDVSGARNVIDDGKNGFIIEQENIDDFIDKLELLIDDRELLKGFSKYTLDNFSKKYSYEMNLEIHRKIIDFLNKKNNMF